MSLPHMERLGLAALLLAPWLAACQPSGGAPAVPANASTPVSVAAPPSTVTPAAPAEAVTAPATEDPPAVPVSLSALPVGAALYAAARTPAVDALLELVPEGGEEARGAIAEMLGGRGRIADVLTGL